MPSLSPKTQQMQTAAGAGPDQETALFEQGFSDMAYSVLMNRMPDLVSDVVTFKVLDVNIDKGTGVGAFVVLRNDQPFYVPVVMADNAIKPLEVLYHKALNTFLPLTKGWLQEVDKTALSTLGKGIKTPETLYTDVDIRNIVVPPITGRFSYASWHQKAAIDVERLLSVDSLGKEAEARPLQLLSLLAAAPNRVKEALVAAFRRAPALAKHAAAVYGVNALLDATRPREEKIAAKQQFGGGLWIAGADDSPTDFRRIFGDRAAEAYAGVRKKGFAAKDDRLERNMAVQEQPYARWIEPNQPGVYVLCSTEGEDCPALVIPNPIAILSKGTRYGRRPAVPGRNPLINNSYRDPVEYHKRVYAPGRPDEADYVTKRPYGVPRYLAVFPNGDYLETDKLAGRDSVVDAVAGGPLHARLFQDVSGAPKAGLGFFVRQKGTTFQATVPFEIKSVTEKDGERRIRAESPGGFDERLIVTDPRHPHGSIWMPEGANVAYLPPDFVWIPLKEKQKSSAYFTSALDLAACASSALASVGARKVSIKDAAAGQFSIDGGPGLNRFSALRKLAFDCVLSVEDADALLTKAAAERSVSAWIASGRQLARAQLVLDGALGKEAADDAGGSKDKDKKPKKPAPKAESAGPDASGDPGGDDMGTQAAMAAMAQQPPAPPPPSPADLATMELGQHIDTEIQKLIEHKQLLDAVAQRASEIAGGAAPLPSVQAQAMGAPPMGGGAPPPMGGGVDPSMMGMGGDPSGGGMPPGMGADPSMMGGGMPPGMGGGAPPPMGAGGGMPPSMGMDPSMMGGGMPPGMDPSMMAAAPGGALPQAPNAMMPPNGPNMQALDGEINPQFLGQAAQLQSADMFDAAAVASLASSPALREIVGQYLPNLEKSVDNLARVLLTLWMQESDLKKQVGEATYDGLEESLLGTFKGMGDLVLRLSQGAQAVQGQFDRAPT